MPVETISDACPLCGGDVKGDDRYKFFCKKCNMLFDRGHLARPKAVEAKPAKPVEPPVRKLEELHYVGSVLRNRYHKKGCRYAAQIKNENLCYFSTIREAEKKGYRPCRCMK